MKTFNEAAQKAANEVTNTLIKKQRDYGQGNILSCPVGPEVGLIVRLNDKINRLANLYKNGTPPSNESLRDSWLDIAGYASIGMMLSDDTFTLPLE